MARFQATPEAGYAMFTGGGGELGGKRDEGRALCDRRGAAGTRPDLTGLSCRWDPIAAKNGEIVSIIVMPRPMADQAEFQSSSPTSWRIIGEQDRGGHPVPREAPHLQFPRPDLDYEARASAPRRSRLLRRILAACAELLIGWSVFSDQMQDRAHSIPKSICDERCSNSDFRKFDDGLKLTVDIDGGAAGAHRSDACARRALQRAMPLRHPPPEIRR